MNKLYSLILLLFPLHLFAQPSVPGPYIIDSDTTSFQLLDNRFWQMIEDTSGGRWNIKDVSTGPVSNRFHENSANPTHFGVPVNTYWIRFRLKNKLPHAVSITLQQRSAIADFFISGNDGKWIHKTSGYNKPWSHRDGFKMIAAVPFSIKPGEEITVYS